MVKLGLLQLYTEVIGLKFGLVLFGNFHWLKSDKQI